MKPNNRKKLTKSTISQLAISKQLTSLKIIELNRILIIFNEIFRINVELNFDLKFLDGIFQNLAVNFF